MQQPWLYKKNFELLWVCGPPFICLLFIAFLPKNLIANGSVNNFAWVVLVLMVDVGHVYSTLFKTYFDANAKTKFKTILLVIPFICFIIAFLTYQLGSIFFWRIIAYTAVFHFIRQQYGLLKIYNRKDTTKIHTRIATFTVYLACIYPMLYWHCYGPFNFEWFTSTDFVFYRKPIFEKIGYYVFVASFITYLSSVIYQIAKFKQFNVPSFLIVFGTLISWYLGIVYFHSDFSFTLFNIICHGIPYMALVWIHTQKQNQTNNLPIVRHCFKKNYWLIFLLIPLVLAFIEEGFWDVWIWKEHEATFSIFTPLKELINPTIKQIIIPLLVVPQFTHYVLDGFIWKVSKGHIPEFGKT